MINAVLPQPRNRSLHSKRAANVSLLSDEAREERIDIFKVKDLRGHDSRVFTAEFSPVDECLLATSSEDSTARIWELESGKHSVISGHGDEAVYTVSWSNDGRSLASGGSDGRLCVWNVETKELKQTINMEGDVFAGVFLSDSKLATASDSVATIWDLETGKSVAQQSVTQATGFVFGGLERNPQATPYVFGLRHCASKGYLALAVSDATLRIWDINLSERVVLKGHGKDVCCVQLRDDGGEMVSGSGDGLAGVWDLTALRVRHVLRGHDGTVHDCCYLPRSEGVCTVSNDRTVRIWNDNGEQVAQVGPDHTAKLCCGASPTMVAIGGGENKSHQGGDFRVSLWSTEHDAFYRLIQSKGKSPGDINDDCDLMTVKQELGGTFESNQANCLPIHKRPRQDAEKV